MPPNIKFLLLLDKHPPIICSVASLLFKLCY